MTVAAYISLQLTATGGNTGVLTVGDTTGLVVGAHVIVIARAVAPIEVKISVVTDSTHFTCVNIDNSTVDLSGYTVAIDGKVTQYAQRDVNAVVTTTYVQRTGDTMTGPLTVQGVIQSTTGGFKFPDNTIQTTAGGGGSGSVSVVAPVTGDGSSGNPLSAQAASGTQSGVVNTTTQIFAGAKTFTGAISASNLSGTNTGNVTVSGTDGLAVSGQALTVAFAGVSQPGVVTSSTQTFGGEKTFSSLIHVGSSGIQFSDSTTQTTAAVSSSPGGSNGFVQFDNSGAFGGDTNFFWDNTNKRLGIVQSVPTQKLEVGGIIFSNTGGFKFPDNTVQTTAAVTATPGGSNTQVQYNNSGVFAGSAHLTFAEDATAPSFTVGGIEPYLSASSSAATDFGTLYAAAPTVSSYIRGFGVSYGSPLYNNALIAGSASWEAIGSGVTRMVIGTSANVPLVIALNDSERMRLTPAGFLGIGTSTPSVQFENAGTGSITTRTVTTSTTSAAFLEVANSSQGSYVDTLAYGSAQSGTSLGIARAGLVGLEFNGNTGTFLRNIANTFMAFGNNDTEYMRILAAGNVGIRTTTPSQPLEVAGQIFSNTGGFRFPDNTVQTTASTVGFVDSPLTGVGSTGSHLGIQTANTSQAGALSATDWTTFNAKVGGTGTSTRVATWSGSGTITSSASLIFTASALQIGIDGSATTPSLTLATTADSNTGLFHPASDTFALATGGIEAWRVDPNQFMSIGTTEPLGRLGIMGTSTVVSVTNMDSIGTGTGTVTVTSSTGMPTSGYCIVISGTNNSEFVKYTVLSGTTVSITARAQLSSTAITHSSAATLEWFLMSVGTTGAQPAFLVTSGKNVIPFGSAGTIDMNTVKLGLSALTAATGATAVGANTGVNATSGTAIGFKASVATGATSGTAIGTVSSVTGSNGTAVGANASSGGNGVAIGILANANASSVQIGRGATTATRQVCFGGTVVPLTDIYAGSGVTDTTPNACIYHATGGSGTDIAGADFTIAAGIGTGAGAGGRFLIQTAPASTTGSTANTLVTRMTVTSDGSFAIASSSTPTSKTQFGASIAYSVTAVNVATTLSNVQHITTSDATAGSFAITLPAASTCTGREYRFKKIDSSANTITVTRAGSDTIDGATTVVLSTQYQKLTIVSNGTTWYIF